MKREVVGEGLALPENIGFRYASVRGYTSVYEARTVAAEERGTRLSLLLREKVAITERSGADRRMSRV